MGKGSGLLTVLSTTTSLASSSTAPGVGGWGGGGVRTCSMVGVVGGGNQKVACRCRGTLLPASWAGTTAFSTLPVLLRVQCREREQGL
jgi:hypothetical protein